MVREHESVKVTNIHFSLLGNFSHTNTLTQELYGRVYLMGNLTENPNLKSAHFYLYAFRRYSLYNMVKSDNIMNQIRRSLPTLASLRGLSAF